jgi:hypothetical protein
MSSITDVLRLVQILARSQPRNPLIAELQDAVLGLPDAGAEIVTRDRRAYRREWMRRKRARDRASGGVAHEKPEEGRTLNPEAC